MQNALLKVKDPPALQAISHIIHSFNIINHPSTVNQQAIWKNINNSHNIHYLLCPKYDIHTTLVHVPKNYIRFDLIETNRPWSHYRLCFSSFNTFILKESCPALCSLDF